MKFKKPKFWDLKKPNLLSYLLLPLTLPFGINNLFFNLRSKKKNLKIKTICVGNIYIGGTGKTPTTIKLYQILKKLNFKVATAKKNYISQLDETIILKNKTRLISADNRKKIIKKAVLNDDKLLIFDDGLQDKSIFYDIKFVCFDQQSWIGNGFLIPSGPLREKINSLKRFDGLFLKNSDSNNTKIIELIKKINPNINIFKTHYEAINLEKLDTSKRYLIFSGIGNPGDFKGLLKKNNINVVDELIYPDHFNYNKNDINKIKDYAKSLKAEIITTEKDYVKISQVDKDDINFLEINLIIENEQSLIDFLKSKIYE